MRTFLVIVIPYIYMYVIFNWMKFEGMFNKIPDFDKKIDSWWFR